MVSRLLLTLSLLILPAACSAESSSAPPPATPVPVDTEVASVSSFTPVVTLLGRVEAHENVPVIVPQAGVISYPERFPTGLQTGARVTRGEALASVANETVRSELIEARLQAGAAEERLERLERGSEAGITTVSELSQARTQAELARARLESAERMSSRLILRAPRSGTLVVEQKWPPGTEVGPQTILASIAAGGDPRIVARASASQRRLLEPGYTVELISPKGDTAIGRGTVTEIDSIVDRTGTASVIVSVPGGLTDLVPGEGVVARALLPERKVVTVPDQAVLYSSEGAAVFTIENGRASRRPVTLGESSTGRVEVLHGLEEGDVVIVTGAAFLSDGQAVIESTEGGPG